MPTVPLLAFGITHLTDARYFAAWDVRYICFAMGAGGITADYFHAMREWVEGPVCVPYLGPDLVGIENALAELQTGTALTHIMVDYGTPFSPPPGTTLTVITRAPVAGYQSALDVQEQLASLSGPVILDFTDGGITWSDLVEGHPFSTGLLHELVTDREVYIHIDLTADELTAVRDQLPGLAFRGSSEEKVGYKSFEDIDDLLYSL